MILLLVFRNDPFCLQKKVLHTYLSYISLLDMSHIYIQATSYLYLGCIIFSTKVHILSLLWALLNFTWDTSYLYLVWIISFFGLHPIFLSLPGACEIFTWYIISYPIFTGYGRLYLYLGYITGLEWEAEI